MNSKRIPLLILLLLTIVSCRTLGSLNSGANSLLPASSVSYSKVKDDEEFIIPTYLADPSDEQIKREQHYDTYAALKRKDKYQSHNNNDFSIFAGSYISRQGILKELGDVGPSLGLEYAGFSKLLSGGKPKSHGWFILWTFDHFWKTNGKLLNPKFQSQDYTNYMLGGGYAYRAILTSYFQFHYRGGVAVNFIEIDTFRSNGDPDDDKYSDITISTIHKLGVDFLIRKAAYEKRNPGSQIRLGPSLFYYFAPNPLGKFRINEGSKGLSPGGSLAWFLGLKFEIH